MDAVQAQYEAYPYPTRDPKDEAKRLVTGSPSHPVEIDHFVFGGARDWSQPIRILVAGGGTGDALIMMAAMLATRKTPAEIHYIDMSTASRMVAEARAAARGLTSITFHSGDLMSAADLGAFDYIDCCGVLHHLPDPEAGFRALAAALAPGGGIGAMVYAPYGRSGVYPLQDALKPLVDGLAPKEQVAAARRVLDGLGENHPFMRNALIGDHRRGDAELYDLLLHARDTAFDAPRLLAALQGAGLGLAGWVEPAAYAPRTYLSDPELIARAAALPAAAQAALAERLSGAIRAHRFYAVAAERAETAAARPKADAVGVVHNAPADTLARQISQRGELTFKLDGLSIRREIDRAAAPLLAALDGRRTLDQAAALAKLDWLRAAQLFSALDSALGGFNHLRYSRWSRR